MSAVTSLRWLGCCYECCREREIETRYDHAAKALCDECAAKPHRAPSSYALDYPPLEERTRRGPEVVVVAGPPGTHHTTTSRYEGRRVDLGALLAEPPRPVPWRVENIVADGTVTLLAGESGSGKSWLAQALCHAVADGRPVLGQSVAAGRALYVDAEMGPTMFVDQRLRPAGVVVPPFEYVDAMGLDLSREADLRWLRSEVSEIGAKFVVIDSLRRVMPSRSENDSDDMAPAVAGIAKLARDTNVAVVLIHHKGDSADKFFRGSTAIRDQVDALFGLLRAGDEDGELRRLRCRGGKGKMRYATEPPDLWLRVAPEVGGVVLADEPVSLKVSTREALKRAIASVLPASTKAQVADAIGRTRDDQTFRAAWADLERDGVIAQRAGQWAVVVAPTPRDHHNHHDPETELCGDCGALLTAMPSGPICVGCASTNGSHP